MQNEELITKATQVIQRQDGSEVRIIAQKCFGAGLHESTDVMVHCRTDALSQWQLCSNRPHHNWRSMSVAEYDKNGRSEALQAVSAGEILRVLNLLGKPMSSVQ